MGWQVLDLMPIYCLVKEAQKMYSFFFTSNYKVILNRQPRQCGVIELYCGLSLSAFGATIKSLLWTKQLMVDL